MTPSNSSSEVAARELAADELADRRRRARHLAACESIESRSIARDDVANRITRNVEHRAEPADACVPETWQILRRLDRARVQQAVAARRVRRDAERVTGWVRE